MSKHPIEAKSLLQLRLHIAQFEVNNCLMGIKRAAGKDIEWK